jgi:spore germination cell wall hydrolase CwlJ-like protein
MGDVAPFIFGGLMLVAAFAFAGHQIGRNAVARTAPQDVSLVALAASGEEVAEKSSLLGGEETMGLIELSALRRHTVLADGKTDLQIFDAGESGAGETDATVSADFESVPRPVLKPTKKVAALAQERLRIEPASVSGDEVIDGTKKATTRMAVAAKPDEIEKSFKLKKAEKQKVIAQRRVRLAEENCLARAVYFEARSESELGQMAVAKVILNRVKSPEYPNTICGVVYQGTQRRNSCQFSFACDGLPDDIRQPGAWAQAKRIAQRAIDGDPKVASKLGGALHYHADYVKPKWARSMRKAIKIGRHIFYTGG